MAINIFISHRWRYEYTDDYPEIIGAVDRSKYTVSDRSVTSDDPIDGTVREVTDAIKGKINSASIILAPARPAAVTPGSMGRKEINYAVSRNKKIIAVKTSGTDSVASYWKENNIPVVACRKDSISNKIEELL